MRLLHRLAAIVRSIVHRDREEAQLDAELQTYVEMSTARKVGDGVPAPEARRLAVLELGGIESVKERVRGERHGHLIDEIGRDARYAVRMFARQPGFTTVILLTLALGIGANTTIFGLINALMLRTLPVPNAHELVLVNLRETSNLGAGGDSLSFPIVGAIDERRDIFSGAGGFTGVDLDLGAPGSVTRVNGGVVTGGFYSTLRLVPAAGRLLTRDDDRPGAPLVAVISYPYWESQFGRRDPAVGQTVMLNGRSVQIVGVTPDGFSGGNVGSAPPVTICVAALPQVRPAVAGVLGPGNFWLRVLARPAPGLSAPEAASRLNAAWPVMAERVLSPNWPVSRRTAMSASVFILEPGATGWTYLRQQYTKPLYILFGVAGIVLLIACANIASLFLARASSRRQEIAVRLAIGAGRGRIIRQLITEGVVISFAGAALGVVVAGFASRLLVDLISTGRFPVVLDLSPEWRVIAFAAALAMATGVVFGLAPAFQLRRQSAALPTAARTMTHRSKLLPTLVVVQIGLALVLVAGGGLFLRSLINLQRLDTGFSMDGVFVVALERDVVPAPDRLLEAVRAVPGVLNAGVATHTPLDGSSWSEAIVPVGETMPETDNALIIGAGPEFLETMRVPLADGRSFRSTDAAGAPPVAVINERYATQYFPGQRAVGHHLAVDLMGTKTTLEIVGVVKNTAAGNLRRIPPRIVYVSFAQFGGEQSPSLVARVDERAHGVAEGVRSALQQMLPTKPIQLVPLSTQVQRTLLTDRLMATLSGTFGALALLLAAIGLYGLLAYSVAQRFREIGIRMALGASSAGVVRDVLAGAARLTGIGLVVGGPIVWLTTKSIGSMLFGLTPLDPIVLGTAAALLGGTAIVASYVPARRASRVDPLRALRTE
jgi:predicted permease